MGGRSSPLYREQGKYLLPLERMIEGFRLEDPPPKSQLAVPVLVAEEMFQQGNHPNASPVLTATGQLGLIAFYYLLRVGEYTINRKNASNNQTRTEQFTVNDISFWKDGMLLNNDDRSAILTADEATMRLTNQKNGQKNGLIHHEANDNGDGLCPVRALAARVSHILDNGGTQDMLLCSYWNGFRWDEITAENIGDTIKLAVVTTGLHKKGITPNDVGSHSLRAGGAMALKLNGISDTTIKKAGRWRSMAFLQYIYNQIGHLSAGVSKAMKTKVPFRNIGGVTKWKNGVRGL